jgi:hypothetical protein
MGKVGFCLKNRDFADMRKSRSGRDARYTAANYKKIADHAPKLPRQFGIEKGQIMQKSGGRPSTPRKITNIRRKLTIFR